MLLCRHRPFRCVTPGRHLKCSPDGSGGNRASTPSPRSAGSRKGFLMRWVCIVAVLLAISAPTARAQDEVKPEDVKRLNDALKAAQDRKNELAAENEKLIARVNELQRQLDHANATFAERTYEL